MGGLWHCFTHSQDLAALCNKLRRAAPDGVITVPNLLGATRGAKIAGRLGHPAMKIGALSVLLGFEWGNEWHQMISDVVHRYLSVNPSKSVN
jgi:hypothetical protein